jgi:hypothetical protein
MSATTGTSSTSMTITTTVNIKTPRHPRIASVMEELCERLGHFGACAILNGRWYTLMDRDDEPHLTIRYPFVWTARFYHWALWS